ncbi:hypothetical protein HMPREF1544_09751 [Mucor circinelloides 1006PhL]|uniref:Uncharacterized protein n=1 Tax=Mucor circinelloides f. circinelloides (strain 1006PhL) TaxID=1220926 RepID=S2J0A5_MUCC1|nr:hypothetical protein HMPREF1544_09751 [Mucor circinelloides 1006PhL]
MMNYHTMQLLSTTIIVLRLASITSTRENINDLAAASPPSSMIKGAERGSVFIDITHVKNLHLLLEVALDALNKDADTVVGRGHNEYLGRCYEKNRFPSYPADASIVRLTMFGLPFLQLPPLKKALSEWLKRVVEVLDLGLTKKDGYATIAIPPGGAASWIENYDGDMRKILLT